jgi:hypothetical protein
MVRKMGRVMIVRREEAEESGCDHGEDAPTVSSCETKQL